MKRDEPTFPDHDTLFAEAEEAFGRNDFQRAAELSLKALSILPDDPATNLLHARILHRSRRPLEAWHFFKRCRTLAPHLPVVHLMTGITALEAERRDEARQAFEGLLRINPSSIAARLCLTMLELDLCANESEIDERLSRYRSRLLDLVSSPLETPGQIEAAAEAIGILQPFFLPYMGRDVLPLQRIYGEWVSRVMALRFPAARCSTPRPGPKEKIRIGIVSAHIRHHSVWKIICRGWLTELDRDRFHLFTYSIGDVVDEDTNEARRLSDVFVQEPDITNLMEIILRHKPHVLIYPGIGMDPGTMKLAALRLAPLQAASWGHPVTTGLPTMDIFLSSDLMEPPGADLHYSERLVRLPNLSICYDPLPLPSPLPRVSIPGVEPGDVTYLCCQNLMKYLPRYDEVFPRIAREIPRAKFVFISFSEIHRRRFTLRLEAAFRRYGLDACDHLVFTPPLNRTGYAALNAVIHVYLDSIGWSGGNTTLESLPFDKPIVTMPGEFMRGRHTAAILAMMGLDEMIASTTDDYVRTAVRLARDPEWYRQVSLKLACSKNRIYGDRRPVRAMEDLFESVCRERSSSAP